MSDSKVFMFPEGMGNNGIDPNLMMALNQNGGFGGNNWMWIFFLFFLFPGFTNGMFGNNVNNHLGSELLMQAVQGNSDAVRSLASTLNCDVESIKNSINSVMSAIQGVGNQVGMSSMQVINSVQAGNTQLGQQIAQCCCENRLAICQLTNSLERAIDHSSRDVQAASDSGFKAVLNKLDNILNQNLLDKIDALREEKTKLSNQLGIEHQNAYTTGIIGQAVSPLTNQLTALSQEVASIKCKLPSTETVTYSPVTAVPNCAFGPYYDRPGNGFWY